MEFKARSGYSVKLTDGFVELKQALKGKITFNISEISDIQIKRSPYDLPGFEKTILIRLKNKKRYPIKRLPKKSAEELYQVLSS